MNLLYFVHLPAGGGEFMKKSEFAHKAVELHVLCVAENI